MDEIGRDLHRRRKSQMAETRAHSSINAPNSQAWLGPAVLARARARLQHSAVGGDGARKRAGAKEEPPTNSPKARDRQKGNECRGERGATSINLPEVPNLREVVRAANLPKVRNLREVVA